MPSVLQDWVQELPFMQQSVLLSAIRGPDDSTAVFIKPFIQWLRRCVLISSLDQTVLSNPYDHRGGKFTGPSYNLAALYSERYNDYYMTSINKDEMPVSEAEFVVKNKEEIENSWPTIMLDKWLKSKVHFEYLSQHYVTHFRDAAQVLGYKHPDETIRQFWFRVYVNMAKDAHLAVETLDDMNWRLDDYRNTRKPEKAPDDKNE